MEENFVRISEHARYVSKFPNMRLVLESRINIFCDIMLSLKHERIKWIEVHGMTGVGKTTLVKEVATFAAEEGLFDEIVWSEVSQQPDVSRIQDQIARAFGFSLDPQESEATRAERILKRLKYYNAKKVLIILDDVWHKSDLYSIGILGHYRISACKVIFTSSKIKDPQNVDRIISMMALPKEEAFIFFNQIVGQSEYTVSTDLVGEILETCEGLPLTIKTVAQKLRGQPLSEWELTLQTLRRSPAEFDHGILSSVKLSYDHLQNQQDKSLFLLCSILGEQIFYDDLVKYAWVLEFAPWLTTLRNALRSVYDRTRLLKRRYLLRDENSSEYVSMSKICRDVAMAVASGDPNWFIVKQDGGATKWPDNDMLAQVRYMSLQVKNNVLELPQGLLFPKLELLHVYDKNGALKIADSFFMGMDKAGLKVLALFKMQLLSLPSYLLDLKNIDTLCLDYCVLGDISDIGKLQSLRVLSLSHTIMQQLPKQIGQLTRLCLLDLSNCSNLIVVPAKLLTKLTKLEYLLMKNSFTDWRVGDNDRSDKPSLVELTSLTSLHTLEIDIPNDDMIPEALPWGKCRTYHIVIGQDSQCYSEDEEQKNYKVLKWNHDNDAKGWLLSLLDNCDVLWLKKSKGFKQVLSKELRLKYLYIQDNAELEYFTRTRFLGWQNLVVVRIKYCPSLRFVFKIVKEEGYDSHDSLIRDRSFLPQLRELEIAACGNMEAILLYNEGNLPFDYISLNCLESLTLQNLDKLVIFCSYADPSDLHQGSSLLAGIDLPHLKHLKLVKISKVTHLLESDVIYALSLQNLETLEIEECNDLSHILVNDDDHGHLLPNLCQLRLQNLPKFKSLIGDKYPQRIIPSFKMLNKLTVRNCNQLRYLLPHYVLEDLKLLQYIDISDCLMLEQVFLREEGTVMTVSEKKVLPFLHCLRLSNLPALVSICSGIHHLIILHLNGHMTIEGCPYLTFSFAYSQDTSVRNSEEKIVMPPLLQNLNLSTRLEKMCDDHLVIFIHLTSLQLYRCENMKCLFSLSVARSLSSLQELKIISCKIIEHFVVRESQVTTDTVELEFPRVTTLILEKLPKFTKFFQDDICTVKWLSLNKLRVIRCPNIKRSTLGVVDRTLLRSVEVTGCYPWEDDVNYLFKYVDKLHIYLKIEGSRQLNKYLSIQPLFSSFTELETLEARKCDRELNKLLSILLRRSQKLEQLTVEKCELLEQVFDLGNFDPQENGLFPNLNTMRLSDLPNLNYLWSKDPSGIIDLRSLVKLEIIKCGSLRNLVSIAVAENFVKLKELYIDSCEMIEEVVTIKAGEEKDNQGRSFPNLNNLHLLSLPNFIRFNLQNLNSRFPNLLRLTIEHCPKMNAFTTGFLSVEALDTSDPMKNKIEDAYLKLESLKLVGLKTYEIWQGYVSIESFREMQELEVDTLSNVQYIFPSGMLLRLEKLTKLVVKNCSSLTNVFQPFENNSVTVAQDLETIQIMNAKIVPHLETIILENLPMLSSFDLLQESLGKLKKLHLINVSCYQLIWNKVLSSNYENSRSEMELLGTLDELVLSDIPSMQLWEQEPEIPVFRNLTSLEIIRCKSIQKLFSIAVAENLDALKLLKLYECQNLVQVLQGGGGNSKKVFKKLECLILKHLPNLTSFCEQDFEFEFPHLQMVRVEGIPKMKTFVKGSLKTPKLKAVYVIFIKKCWQGNLNATIKYLNENQDELKAKVDCASLLTFQNAPVNSFRFSTIAAESSSEVSLFFFPLLPMG